MSSEGGKEIEDTFEDDEEFDDFPASRNPPNVKASAIKVCASALGGSALGAALGFGVGLVAREGSKSAALESAFALRSVAIMSAVYTGVLEVFAHLQHKIELPGGVDKALAGCTAGLAAAVPGPPSNLVRGCASFGLAAFLLDLALPASANAFPARPSPRSHSSHHMQAGSSGQRGVILGIINPHDIGWQVQRLVLSLAVPLPFHPAGQASSSLDP